MKRLRKIFSLTENEKRALHDFFTMPKFADDDLPWDNETRPAAVSFDVKDDRASSTKGDYLASLLGVVAILLIALALAS